MPVAPANKRVAAPDRQRLAKDGRGRRPFKVDRKLLGALGRLSPGEPVVVTMKLRREGAQFADFPMSNDRGSARARAFADAVDALLSSAGDQGGKARIIQRAANLGLVTVEAPASVVKHLLDSAQAKLETLDLAREGSTSQY